MKEMISHIRFTLSLKITLAVSAAAVICGFIIGTAAGISAVIFSMCFIAVSIFTNAYRDIQISKISDSVDRLLHGEINENINEYSEGELSILKNEINKMMTKIREQQQILSDDKIFLADSLADISHQLRTPLTAMNLIVSLLGDSDTDEEKKRELLREMNGLLRRVDWLITTLLKISKLDAGTIKFNSEEINVENLLNKACMPLQIPMELREQQLVIRGSGNFCGDVSWTCEAIGNIVKNCMEHTPDGGRITVEGESNPIFTELRIYDTGCGIAEKDLPHLFERFYRGDSSDENSFGIGLSLAKKIVTSQNGTIKASNRADGGAEFTIKFYKVTV